MRVTSRLSSGSGIPDGENKPRDYGTEEIWVRMTGYEESYRGSLQERMLPHRPHPPPTPPKIKAGIA